MGLIKIYYMHVIIILIKEHEEKEERMINQYIELKLKKAGGTT